MGFCHLSLFKGHPHPPKPPQKTKKGGESGTTKIAFLHCHFYQGIFISLQSEISMDLRNTPMSRVGCTNDENLENQADQFWAFLPNLLHKTVNTKVPCHKY